MTKRQLLDEANREAESASFQEEIERMKFEMEMADGKMVVKLIPDIKKYLE